MAHCHTALPERWKGEQYVAQQLIALPDPKLHLWFSINYLPITNEIDLLVWHEDHGVFVIETKGVYLPAVLEYGCKRCSIAGRPTDDGPHNQARRAQIGLREYLSGRIRAPFIVSTACWPRITRAEWIRRWQDPRVIAQAPALIFADDLEAGPDVFQKRLAEIWRRPPTPGRPTREFSHWPSGFRAFMNELDFTALPKPTQTDLQRLEAIEHTIHTQTDDEVPPHGTHHICYSGHPGTGKTFRLLRIGHQHAVAGRDVLFACYNKVLATDQKRLLGFSQKLKLAQGTLRLYDVFALVSEHAELHGLPRSSGDPDAWAQVVLEHMRCNPPQRKFDTVLIDESQDMRDWAFEVLALHARPAASLCVANGVGQGLYGPPAEWLKRFQETSRPRRLNRNFRNTKPVFVLAQTCYEAKFDASKLERALARFRFGAPDPQTELEFDRPDGQATILTYLDDSPLEALSPTSALFPRRQHELMVSGYRRIMRSRLDAMRASERPMDLLVLVPGEGFMERDWARDALTGLTGVEVIDYTDEKNRRKPTRPETVRLCTFHSSRGIEGTRVIVFGLHHLERMGKPAGSDAPNLGYITLSRATFECEVVVRTSQADAPVLAFVQDAITQIVGGLATR